MAKRCRFCGKRFPTDVALKRHLRDAHRGYYYGLRVGILILLTAALAASAYSYFILLHGTPATPSSTYTSSIAYSVHSTYQKSGTRSRSAPDFTLPEISSTGLTGRNVSLSDFRGRAVFLEFMSPLCPHCVKMTPIIRDLWSRYGDRVAFISVMWVDVSDKVSLEAARRFIEENGVDWIHVVDSDGSVFWKYGVEGTPTYVILDSGHVEVARFIGSGTSEQELEDALQRAA